MANNFSADSRIIDFWRFENNLTAGKAGNNLTASAGGVSYESGSPLEGSYSLNLDAASNQWATRDDGDLTAGFPLKDGGTNIFSIAFWFRPHNIAFNQGMVTKGDATTGLRIQNNAQTLYITWGYGSGYLYWEVRSLLGTNKNYHVGVAIDGDNRTALVRVWDEDAATATTYTKNTWTQDLVTSTVPFAVGVNGNLNASYDFDGWIDEVVIADDLLSADEFDAIRNGTFGAGLSSSPSLSPSLSPSISPSPSVSQSLSPSISPSPSVSESLSPSASPSESVSVSLSPSISPSLSPSVSPSVASMMRQGMFLTF